MQIQNQDIQQLFQAIAQGNKTAFSRCHQEYFLRLKQYAFNILKSEEQAEEATSDVFVLLWTRREKLNLITHPQLYLFKIIKNNCLNRLRQSKNSPQYSPFLEEEPATMAESPAQILENKELFNLLQAAVESLPEQRRLIFKLIKEEDLKHKEVAALLDLSVRTVENQLYKAVRQLAGHIEAYLDKNPTQRNAGQRLLMLFI